MPPACIRMNRVRISASAPSVAVAEGLRRWVVVPVMRVRIAPVTPNLGDVGSNPTPDAERLRVRPEAGHRDCNKQFGDVVLVVTHRFCTPKLGVRLPPSPPGTSARKPPDLSSIGSKSGARFARGDQPDEPQDDRPRTNFFLFAACVGLVITLV
jgi:hypothetical protein